MLSTVEKTVLTDNFETLVDNFQYQSMIAKLISNRIFDKYEVADFDSIRNEFRRNRVLLSKIYSKPEGTFKKICELISELSSLSAEIGKELLHKIKEAESSSGPEPQPTEEYLQESRVKKIVKDEKGRDIEITIVDPDSTAKQYFDYVYKNIGVNWKDLAYELDIAKADINTIAHDNPNDVNEQCSVMLHQHYRATGKKFTKFILVKAMYGSGLSEVAESILSIDDLLNRQIDEYTTTDNQLYYKDENGKPIKITVVEANSPANLYFNTVYKVIGEDWKDLARKLGMDMVDIKAIAHNYSASVSEQCIDMLHKCSRAQGSKFTKAKLVFALIRCGLTDVAESIREQSKK